MLTSALALLLLGSADSCAIPALLPAYSHNDYNQRRPLLDALAAGYRGVEADVIREGQVLVVAHDRRNVRPSRTLARLYLEPLRLRYRDCARVLADTAPFYLNIEVKEADARAFRLLIAELAKYEELFSRAVQVTLVGSWLPPDSEIVRWPAYVKVSVSPAGPAPRSVPLRAGLAGLISIDYGTMLRWDGQGPAPQQGAETLRQARRVRDSLHIPIRVHHAPLKHDVVKWLLAEGVGLIGVTDLERGRTLLH